MDTNNLAYPYIALGICLQYVVDNDSLADSTISLALLKVKVDAYEVVPSALNQSQM